MFFPSREQAEREQVQFRLYHKLQTSQHSLFVLYVQVNYFESKGLHIVILVVLYRQEHLFWATDVNISDIKKIHWENVVWQV